MGIVRQFGETEPHRPGLTGGHHPGGGHQIPGHSFSISVTSSTTGKVVAMSARRYGLIRNVCSEFQNEDLSTPVAVKDPLVLCS